MKIKIHSKHKKSRFVYLGQNGIFLYKKQKIILLCRLILLYHLTFVPIRLEILPLRVS
jgi:hypothetical protein